MILHLQYRKPNGAWQVKALHDARSASRTLKALRQRRQAARLIDPNTNRTCGKVEQVTEKQWTWWLDPHLWAKA
ncbi:MAG: hypothetical protein E6J34_14900 [Chloroflexi bacterium]|nr:MAG: hypothetical protein E6J34_14900 [Chloroflexota bacterium]